MTSRLAGLAIALSLLNACGFSRDVTASRILDRRDVVLDRVREPSRDQFLVAPAFRDGELVLHVEHQLACTRHVQEVLTVRDTIDGPRHPGAANTGAALVVAGGSILAFGAVASAHASSREQGSETTAGGTVALGALMAFAGAFTFVASKPNDTEYRTRQEKRPPKTEQTMCGTEPPIGAIADLELPDGSRIAARIDAAGDAHFALPAAIFTVDPLPTIVRVDGATVQRLLIPRP